MKVFSAILLLTAFLPSASSTPFSPSNHVSVLRAMRGGSADVPPPPTNNAEVAPIPTVDINEDNNEDTNKDENVTAVDYKLGPNAPAPGYIRRKYPNIPYYRIPNVISIVRCIAIPVLVPLFYRPNSHVASAILFAFASITDWIDGYLARLWDISSPVGALLDTIADKLLVATTLILLAGRYGAEIAIPTTIIVSREIAVTALREWMAQQGVREVVKFQHQGKVKTAATMISLTILLLVPNETSNNAGVLGRLYSPGLALLYLCAVLTVTSGSQYFRVAAPYMTGKQVSPPAVVCAVDAM